ncbi:MAG: porin [Bacteroidia bacterium]|nr:porin [Bacteroidia bacterium]
MFSSCNGLWAQGSEIYGKGIRLNLNEDGSRFIRFITWHQIWIRYIDNNPGTLVNGLPEAGTWDIGLRRSRFLWVTQISPKYLILTHIGINNQTFVNGGGSGTTGIGGYGVGKKPQIFLHDFWNEYMVLKDKLYIGTGLHYWNGVTRLASASTLNFLALDAPIFNWALIEETDQFARQFGIYAKGKLGRLDYRIAANKPFATPQSGAVYNPAGADKILLDNPNRAFAYQNNSWALAGYFTYDFFEKESNYLPFFVGTYVGTKKVWNVGGGFHFHPNATRSFDANTNEFKNHNMQLFGIDTFLDLPLNKEKGTAVTAYLAYMNYNFGQNYIRSVGIMNEGVAGLPGALRQGGGNADWRIGTGTIIYAEAGYLLPKSLLKDKGKIQPFASATYRNFEYTAEPALNYSVGFNYYIDGHHAKISVKYNTRPIYNGADGRGAAINLSTGVKERLNTNPDVAGGKKSAGEFIIQTMIYL